MAEDIKAAKEKSEAMAEAARAEVCTHHDQTTVEAFTSNPQYHVSFERVCSKNGVGVVSRVFQSRLWVRH